MTTGGQAEPPEGRRRQLRDLKAAADARSADAARNGDGERTHAEIQRQLEGLMAASDGADGEATAEAALSSSRVDLIERIRNGIPEATYVPGCAPYLRAGKRNLWVAPAGTGKTLVALITGVTAVEHGGTVVILDVENGADEYARRLEDILRARDPDGTCGLAEACQERLRYHDWPRFSLKWTPEAWVKAVAGADLTIFDSSRLSLSSVGLAEDSNDDYSRFLTALVVPLSRAGTTTLILDNTGHNAKDRARGASSKADLNEVVYLLKLGAPFDRDRAGHLRLIRERTRFSDIPRELHVHVGGATYAAPVVAEEAGEDPASTDFRPTTLMERSSRAIETTPGLSRNAIKAKISGKREYVELAIELLVAEGYVRIEPGANRANLHYSEQAYRVLEDDGPQVGPEWGPSEAGSTGAPVEPSGALPTRKAPPTAPPARPHPVGPDEGPHHNGNGDVDPDLDRAEAILARFQQAELS